ncbi:MAG: hypothetical protein PHP50_07905 [Lachnospiraceae bacterium]|nr:hypothetical protein [Lachnospiraceae bacterium]
MHINSLNVDLLIDPNFGTNEANGNVDKNFYNTLIGVLLRTDANSDLTGKEPSYTESAGALADKEDAYYAVVNEYLKEHMSELEDETFNMLLSAALSVSINNKYADKNWAGSIYFQLIKDENDEPIVIIVPDPEPTPTSDNDGIDGLPDTSPDSPNYAGNVLGATRSVETPTTVEQAVLGARQDVRTSDADMEWYVAALFAAAGIVLVTKKKTVV